MSLTNTERVALWGQKENPEKYREYQLKEKKRYRRKNNQSCITNIAPK